MREFPSLGEPVDQISPAAFKRRLDDGEEFTLLDTRKPDEYESWQITHPNLTVVNIPFMRFLDADNEHPATAVPAGIPEGPLVTCCAKGLSSFYVAEFLHREGFDVLALEDGMEGWANLYQHRPVETASAGGEVIQFHRPSSGCLSYLFVADGEAAVIDPLRAFTEEYATVVGEYGATLEYAIDTHVHADHVSGVREVAAATAATAVLPAGATERGLEFDATLVDDGETFALGDREITARALPGHTTEMTGYEFAGVLASGDTVFLDSVARTELEDEQAARDAAGVLWETVQALSELDDGTTVAPGHVGPTTAPGEDGSFSASVADLQERLRAFDEPKEAFIDRVTSNLPPQPANFAEIIDLNLGRTSADSEAVFELELGPNNCAVSE